MSRTTAEHAAEARAEIALMAQRALDAIKVKIGGWIRSDAQQARRRREIGVAQNANTEL